MMRCSVSAVMNAPSTGPSDRLYGNRIVLSTVRANVNLRFHGRIRIRFTGWRRAGSRRWRLLRCGIVPRELRTVSRRRYEALVDQPSPDRPAPTGRQIEIAHGDQRATVVELGGALRSLRGRCAAADRRLRERRDGSGSRGQVLMPWPNRIAGGSYEFGGDPSAGAERAREEQRDPRAGALLQLGGREPSRPPGSR